MAGALSGLRVIDSAGDGGALAGRLLAELGATVVLVEPPGGVALRQRPPFADGMPEGENSLPFLHYHAGKHGVTIDLDDPAGRDRFAALTRSADVVLNDGSIDPAPFLSANPRLVWTAITPYGLTGPHAGRLGTGLTIAASGGLLLAMGWEEDPPYLPGGDQAYASASQQAVIGTLAALSQRDRTGRGQLVDLSMAESAAAICQMMPIGVVFDGSDQGRRPRTGRGNSPGDGMYPCADGEVFSGSGPVPLRHWREFIDWMAEEGLATEWVGDDRWLDMAFRIAHADEVDPVVRAFFLRHTKAELCDGSIPRGFMLFPIQDARDLLADPQLRARGFFQELTDRGRTLPYTGPPYRLSATPARLERAAPRLGATFDGWPGRANPPAAAGDSADLPLSGVRIVSFTHFIAGPLACRWLADLGADVIKIETRNRPDAARLTPPFPDTLPERTLNQAGWYASCNAGVRSITLDLNARRAVAIVKSLIDRADILIDNFAPGTLVKWGFDPPTITADRPDLIVVSMPLVGAEGPRSGLSGGGNHLNGFAGLSALTGPEGGEPGVLGPRGLYGDYGPNPSNTVIAVLAALHHRRATGQGQRIEIAQLESVVSVTGPAILEYAANGTIPPRLGNRSRFHAPHNLYACRDGWCAVAVETDNQWRALAAIVGGDASLSASQRKTDEASLDGLVTAWSQERTLVEAIEMLQAAGVPAAPVNDGRAMLADPQLAHRGHYRYLDHPDMGPILPHHHLAFRLSDGSDTGPRSAAPIIGEHTDTILRDELGFSDDRIADYRAAGVLT